MLAKKQLMPISLVYVTNSLEVDADVIKSQCMSRNSNLAFQERNKSGIRIITNVLEEYQS